MRTITLAALCLAPIATAEEQKIELSVLYAGAKDDPRTAEFVGFLSKTFTRVEAIDVEALNPETAKGADVVLIDSPSPYKEGKQFQMPRKPLLGDEWTRPTILMGAAGGQVLIERKTLKLNWL